MTLSGMIQQVLSGTGATLTIFFSTLVISLPLGLLVAFARMSDIRFASPEHRDFFLDMMGEARRNDCYHRAFFYVMGIAPETRANIRQMFDFKQDCIEPDGMHGGWQTSGTVRVCRLAFNLWNGYTDPDHSNAYSPEDLFCCEFAPFFMEGVKIRYPEYCRELPPAKKQAEPAR